MTTRRDIAQAIAYADILLDECPGSQEIEFVVWTLDNLASIFLSLDQDTDIETILEKE